MLSQVNIIILTTNSDVGTSAQHLKAAITQLPELRDRKALLDMHMNIATALLKGIKDRHLDDFYEMEENITKQTKLQLLEIINDPERKNPTDKMRAFIIWYSIHFIFYFLWHISTDYLA